MRVENFNNVEDGWNNFRKMICEVADGVLGKKARIAARNINEKPLCLFKLRDAVDSFKRRTVQF